MLIPTLVSEKKQPRLVTWNSQVRKTGLEFREFPLGIPGIPMNSLKPAL